MEALDQRLGLFRINIKVPGEIVTPSGGFDQRAILIILMLEWPDPGPAKVNLALAVGPLDEGRVASRRI